MTSIMLLMLLDEREVCWPTQANGEQQQSGAGLCPRVSLRLGYGCQGPLTTKARRDNLYRQTNVAYRTRPQPDGASARPSSPSSPPGIPANQPCPARLDKQIGHSTGTAAVIGKKMDLRSENISPEHGRQIAQLSDIQSIFCRPFTWYPPTPPPFLTPGAASPASIPELRIWNTYILSNKQHTLFQ
ncbi:unnamed protein product [Pleuronectes platessa]|uniref:Uncharacterized protein n=1 Tax=Pleuronectes platessa TaxID=8262 RepID=A0A9N7TRT7_PLEPL|nr:unnamed protein product [Pleuronectes platessa]